MENGQTIASLISALAALTLAVGHLVGIRQLVKDLLARIDKVADQSAARHDAIMRELNDAKLVQQQHTLRAETTGEDVKRTREIVVGLHK